MTFYLLLPALLVFEIYHADFSNGRAQDAVAITFGVTVLLSIFLLALRPLITRNTPLFTSIFQGSIRYNSYVLLAVSSAIFGREGLALAVIFITVMVITTNALAVIVLNHFAGGRRNILSIFTGLLRNPIILGAGAGAILNIAKIPIPDPIMNTAGLLKSAALPLSLLSVGAGLRFVLNKDALGATCLATILKLAILPALTYLALYLAGIEGHVMAIGVLYAAMPAAGNAYIMARQLNGDAQTMASIITVQTLIAAISISVIAALLQS